MNNPQSVNCYQVLSPLIDSHTDNNLCQHFEQFIITVLEIVIADISDKSNIIKLKRGQATSWLNFKTSVI